MILTNFLPNGPAGPAQQAANGHKLQHRVVDEGIKGFAYDMTITNFNTERTHTQGTTHAHTWTLQNGGEEVLTRVHLCTYAGRWEFNRITGVDTSYFNHFHYSVTLVFPLWDALEAGYTARYNGQPPVYGDLGTGRRQ